ncbi:MAG: putative mannose-6-phosphate isomerase GmuF [Bacteroidetes bacterium ADurb.Bin174]|jgi:mannose-6-phosphate isomerase|nr:MAG: putative mannose-6-phosphate isomerase GmuF [Bacteroidetes bacterium ADurb.Bin174]
METLYPLKFTPILKDKIWGGSKLQQLFGKKSKSNKVGESWELSGYNGDLSVVNNGPFAGKNIVELIEMYKEELVGKQVYDRFGNQLPLLFKFIYADDKLSIQVHPDDEVAMERHQSSGKTEMWYVIDAEPGSKLVIGFLQDITREDYLKALEEGRLDDLLQKVEVSAGDVFFIPAGLVHAIGKGIVLAEIQQTSDLTYRIYDYKRPDESGKERQLHTEEALDVIDFSASADPKTIYSKSINELATLVSCDYFTTNIVRFNEQFNRFYGKLDSFVVYMCVEGNFEISCNGDVTKVKKGETVLIPASVAEVELLPQGEVTLLEVYIN